MASQGILFLDAHSAISHTAPAHASLFTSLYPQQHRLLRNGEPLADSLLTLAELLGDRGYETGAFVAAGFLRGLADGFDTFEVQGPPSPQATSTLAAARDWMAERAGRRTFVWIHLFDVHQWYVDQDVDPRSAEEARARTPQPADGWAAFLAEAHGVAIGRPGRRREALEAIDRYDGQLLRVDRALEEFFDSLEARAAEEHALWIVTSDHGEGLGAHDFLGHGKNLYEEQLRVPLLLRFPGDGSAGLRIHRPVQLLDLFPTLAELTGGLDPLPSTIGGRSLVPLLRGADLFEERPLFAERRPADRHELESGWDAGKLLSYRDGSWKLILSSAGRLELYDLAADPLELHDRSADEPEVLERLRAELLRRFRQLRADGAAVQTGEIDPEHVKELEALGYL
jgi:arylsulfatase A-like enzyme